MRIYWQLFFSFFKIGLCTFGGGYAALPLIQKEILQHNWGTEKEILNYYTMAQVTPGIISVNVSTFIGYKIRGIWGAVCTMFGIITPSLLIITALTLSLTRVWHQEWIQSAFGGIQLMIPALIIPILTKMIRDRGKTSFAVFIIITAVIMRSLAISPIIILLSAALMSILYSKMKEKK